MMKWTTRSFWQSKGFAPGSLGETKCVDFLEIETERRECVHDDDQRPHDRDNHCENGPADTEVFAGIPRHRDQEHCQR
jgi:hypothetical protein